MDITNIHGAHIFAGNVSQQANDEDGVWECRP